MPNYIVRNPLMTDSAPPPIQTVALQGQPGSWQWRIEPLGNEYRIFGSPPETDKFQLMGRENSQEDALKRTQMLKTLLGGE
jgi:hypothetical protein